MEKRTNSYIESWQFIMDYLPNYSSRDDVLEDDILFRYLHDEEVQESDLEGINNAFNGDKSKVAEYLVELETKFAEEALRAYYYSKLSQR